LRLGSRHSSNPPSATKHGAAKHSTTKHSTTKTESTTKHGPSKHSATRRSTTKGNSTKHSTTKRHATKHSTTKHGATAHGVSARGPARWRSAGRHAAPLTLRKATRRVVTIAPTVAVAATLVAATATQAHGSGTALGDAIADARSASPSRLDQAESLGGTPASIESLLAGTAGRRAAVGAASGAVGRTRRSAALRHAHSGARRPSTPARIVALRCTGTTGLLPQNYAAIMMFLTEHGYTPMAAAGIAGNMYQESGGNPESVGTGGGGLIGFTPLPAGYVTGNVAADLRTQLEAVLAYNEHWAQYLPALNAATSPTQAADIYMDDFERPGDPAAYNREAAANAVAAACGF